MKKSFFKEFKNDSMIDVTDNRILELLKINSRQSFADLGRKINLSPSSVRERIQKLEDSGIIKKYCLILDNKKLGYDLEAFILIRVFQGQLIQVIDKIKDLPQIHEVHRVTGDQNLHLKVIVKDQNSLQKLLDQLMIFGDTNTFLILSQI